MKDETYIRTTPLTSMMFNTGSSDPVSQKAYPITMRNYQWMKEEIEKLLAAKVIHSSRSSWSALIIVVPTGDGENISYQLQSSKQGYQKIHFTHAKS